MTIARSVIDDVGIAADWRGDIRIVDSLEYPTPETPIC
jgi:hypothetical protein